MTLQLALNANFVLFVFQNALTLETKKNFLAYMGPSTNNFPQQFKLN